MDKFFGKQLLLLAANSVPARKKLSQLLKSLQFSLWALDRNKNNFVFSTEQQRLHKFGELLLMWFSQKYLFSLSDRILHVIKKRFVALCLKEWMLMLMVDLWPRKRNNLLIRIKRSYIATL